MPKKCFFSGPTFSRITTNLPSRLWLVFFLLFFLFFFNKLQCSPLCPNKWPKMIKKNVSKAFNTTLINCFLWILEMDLRRQKKKLILKMEHFVRRIYFQKTFHIHTHTTHAYIKYVWVCLIFFNCKKTDSRDLNFFETFENSKPAKYYDKYDLK